MLFLSLLNRLLAALLSLALLAAVAVTATEAVRWVADEEPWVLPWPDWEAQGRDLLLGDTGVLVVAAVAAAVGLLLLLFELSPRRPAALTAEPVATGVDTVATRAGVRGAAVNAAQGIAGVDSARAKVVRARVDVDVRSRARGEVRAGLKEDVQRSVEASLAALEMRRPLRVRARIGKEDA